MRHLSPRRLPPFPHDPSRTPFQAVRPLSAASADITAAWPVSSSAPTAASTLPSIHEHEAMPSLSMSRTVTVPLDGVLLSRLSRRQMRQREQKWGALWRYRPETYTLPSLRASPVPSSPLLTASATTSKKGRSDEGTQGSSVTKATSFSSSGGGEGITAVSNGSLTRSQAIDKEGGSGVRSASFHGSGVHSGGLPGETFASAEQNAAFTEPSSSSSETPKDALLAFLETHEDDAAELVAMWTSLHRSCVYASELSESVVLQVRYFFHSLLHNRAIAAAVEFYYRLMGLGVQLQQSDLLLLLSSLPYEHATTTEAAQLQKAQEDAAMAKDRRVWEERRRRFKEAAERTQRETAEKASDASVVRGDDDDGRVKAGSDETHGLYDGTKSQVVSATQTDKMTTSGQQEETEEAHPPLTIARRVAFQQQPEWIKRWILYEASMGTLDGLDSVDVNDPVHARLQQSVENGSNTPTSAAATAGGTALVESAARFFDTAAAFDTSVQSERATRMMELAAITDHLRLLTLGAMQRHQPMRLPQRTALKARTRSLVAPSQSSTVAEKLYWREALRVVRNTFAAPLWSTPADAINNSGPAVGEATVILSSDVTATLLSMMREAQTWEGAMALCRLKVMPLPSKTSPQANLRPRQVGLAPENFQTAAVAFVALAARAQPWKAHASVEEWMHQCVFPHVSGSDAAGATSASSSAVTAMYALWLSHLCGVKAARPEQFITMAEEVAAYMPPPQTRTRVPEKRDVAAGGAGATTLVSQLLNGDLAIMLSDVLARAEAAVAALHAEVEQSMRNRRAAQVLARSIQSGAFRPETGEGENDVVGEAKSALTSMTSTASAPGTTPQTGVASTAGAPSASLLTPAQLDAFVLCCSAIKESVWLRFSTAAADHRATVTAEALQFLERTLYGETGLHTLFRELYSGTTTSHDHTSESRGKKGRQQGFVDAATAAAAPERAFVVTVLSTTLLELAQLFAAPASASSSQRRGFGSQLGTRDTVALLVELARQAVDSVQPKHIKATPWRWATEANVSALVTATARTIHVMVRETDIQPKNEKVAFGALPERDVQLLADLARIVMKTSELCTTTQQQQQQQPKLHPTRAQGGATGTLCPVWRVLTATASPRVLQGVQLCFRRSSALGKRVRHQLTRHEGERLDALFFQSPRRRLRSRMLVEGRQETREEAQIMVSAVPRAHLSDGDFLLALTMRDAVYAAVQRGPTTEHVRGALQQLAEASTDWKASLRLCQMVTKDMYLTRGTCDVKFFKTILENMTKGIAESEAVAAAAAAAGSAPASYSRSGRHPGGSRVKGMKSVVGPPSLWLSAIDVFWSAVDHTAGTADAAADKIQTDAAVPPTATSKERQVGGTGELRERAVLAELLLPLVEFSTTVRRSDLGRRWRRAWMAKYSTAEKDSLSFRQKNILALSLLRDTSALERCVAGYGQLGYDEALLCRVAVQHSNWQRALEALFSLHGSIEEKERVQACYSLNVTHALLKLLSRSPKNLSNTAMRLETLQGDVWDAACSAAVVRLLLRARRWSLALRHVDMALSRQPAMQTIDASIREALAATSTALPLLSPQEVLPYVQLLTLAVQATAIGGDSDAAPRYYDAIKCALQCVSLQNSTAADAPEDALLLFDGDSSSVDTSGLDAVFDMTSPAALVQHTFAEGTATSEEKDCYAELRELAGRSRLMFFRAMTKKLVSQKAHASSPMSESPPEDSHNAPLMAGEEYWGDAMHEDEQEHGRHL